MKFRILVLTAFLVACTRSVEGSPIATPPITVLPETPAAVSSAAPSEVPSAEATPAAPTAVVPVTNRLPKGEPAAEALAAPSGEWSIWRRGTDAGQVFRVDAGGEVVEIRLPALEGTRPSPEFALSPDGALIAYTLLDSGSGVVARALAVYEPVTGRLQTAELDPEAYNLVDFGTLTAAFSPDGTQVALALEGNPLNTTDTPQFKVYLWNLQTNEVIEGLNPDSAINRNLLPEQHTPLPVQWWPEGVLLAGRLYQSTTYSKTMLWDPATNRVTAAPDTSAAFALRGQRLPDSTEVVWPDYDGAYPALPLDCWGSVSPDNVLKLIDLAGGKTHIIFAAGAGEQINRVRWLDGGQQLALLMIGCDRQATRLIVLDRQGAVRDTVPVSGSLAMFATDSSLLVLEEDPDTNQTTVTAYDAQQNWAATQVAQFPGTLGSAGYTFGFVTRMTGTTGLAPFPEVGAQASLSGLEIGRTATVASSSGVLNLRTEPNQDAPALGLLAAGDEVKILDGPVTAPGGLVYWQVEAANGLVGWCVESVEGEQTLIPKP